MNSALAEPSCSFWDSDDINMCYSMELGIIDVLLGVESVVISDVGSENEGGDSGKLDEDVDGWSGGVLEWISNGVSNNGGNVAFSEVSGLEDGSFDFLSSVGVEVIALLELLVLLLVGIDVTTGLSDLGSVYLSSLLSLLLGVIPGSSSVGG